MRRLGQSNLMASPIGLGCWQFSKGSGLAGKYWPVLTDDEIQKIVAVSLEGGLNWFDTAESYGMGQSEKALSQALKSLGQRREEVIIATKWLPLFRTSRSITKTIDERLKNLGGTPIDLHQIHHPFAFSSTKAQMKAMARLVENQKIRFIGVSNFSAEKMRKAHKVLAEFGLPLVSNQVRYNLLNRKIETNGILDTARELGISIIAYSPLAQGILSGKFHKDLNLIKRSSGYRKYMGMFKAKGLEKSRPVIHALKELAQKYQATPSQIALNWLIHFQGDIVVAIPGATKVHQATENAGAMAFRLTPDDLDYLDQISSPFRI